MTQLTRLTPQDGYHRTRLSTGHSRQQSARRAYALIRSAIRDGHFPVLGQLTEDALVRDLGASRNAVRSALQKLGGDGLVVRRPRVGTVVVSEIGQFPVFECSDDSGPLRAISLELIETQTFRAGDCLAARLAPADESVHMNEFVIRVGTDVVGIFSRFGRVPAPVLEERHPTLTGEERTWYRRIHGERPGAVEATIEAMGADERTARLLSVDVGHPLLVRETFYKDKDLQPAELHYTFFDSRRAALRARA